MFRAMLPLGIVLGSMVSCARSAPVPDAQIAAPSASPPPIESPQVALSEAAPAQPTASVAPSASAAPEPSASAPSPVASAAPAPAAPELPAVTVTNIGMHIGGGPNDDVTKEPIRKSVEPHFEALQRCWASVETGDKAGDFGVDLRIPKGGGKAKVTQPRTAFKGAAFKDCVVKVFEAIEFLPPRKGETVVSYSLRFAPKR